MVVLDTSIIIDHLRQAKKEKSQLDKITASKPKEILAISIITIQELYEGQSTKDLQKEQYLLATIASLKVLSYTYEVAKLAGIISRDAKRSLAFVDATIAATTIINGASLFTLNKKHFVGIENLAMIDS